MPHVITTNLVQMLEFNDILSLVYEGNNPTPRIIKVSGWGANGI